MTAGGDGDGWSAVGCLLAGLSGQQVLLGLLAAADWPNLEPAKEGRAPSVRKVMTTAMLSAHMPRHSQR